MPLSLLLMYRLLSHHHYFFCAWGRSWVWVYGLLVCLVILVALPRSAFFFVASVRATTSVHDTTALRVMRAPLSFFHTNPVGRMLNRREMHPRCLLGYLV